MGVYGRVCAEYRNVIPHESVSSIRHSHGCLSEPASPQASLSPSLSSPSVASPALNYFHVEVSLPPQQKYL